MAPKKSISRDRLVAHLDNLLDVASIEDHMPNGLQIEGASTVSSITYAVDAAVITVKAAVRAKADMLMVHHGLFWEKQTRITGNVYKRVAPLIKNNISLYGVHLPLDCHQGYGNNVELARLFDLEITGRFAVYMGTQIGTLARTQKTLHRDQLKNIIEKQLGDKAEMLPFGPEKVRKIGIISGNAAGYAEEAKKLGCSVLITGETDHVAYHMARDAGINLIYGGHYTTETVGLKALKRHIEDQFGIKGKFIPAPTGY